MKNLRTYLRLAVLACGFLLNVADASAEDISGTITFTKTIFEDSQLVGDVTCTMTDSPCIDFGAPHIKLWLNGFTITGPASPDAAPDPANPAAFCNAGSESSRGRHSHHEPNRCAHSWARAWCKDFVGTESSSSGRSASPRRPRSSTSCPTTIVSAEY